MHPFSITTSPALRVLAVQDSVPNAAVRGSQSTKRETTKIWENMQTPNRTAFCRNQLNQPSAYSSLAYNPKHLERMSNGLRNKVATDNI